MLGAATGFGRVATWMVVGATMMGLSTAGCAIEGPSDDEEAIGAEGTEAAFAQQGFDDTHVIGNAELTDAHSMTATEVQAFLENNPYGWRSVLADVVSNGVPASQAIVDAAQTHGINPLVILTRVQLEQSLIGKTTATQAVLDKAMGCGCPDNAPCSSQYKGFDKQIDCMASKFRSYLDDQAQTGTTIAGWGVGIAKKTLDDYTIVPENEATAAIYTYTPWRSSAKNHAAIWALYTQAVGYTGPQPPELEPGGGEGEGEGGAAPGLPIVIDDDDASNGPDAAFEASANWTTTSATPGYHHAGYAYRSTGPSSDVARFQVRLDAPQSVVVDAWWTAGANRAPAAPFLIYAGETLVGTTSVNQQQNGGAWVELGTFPLEAGWNTIALSRWTTSGYVVVADAVRVRPAP